MAKVIAAALALNLSNDGMGTIESDSELRKKLFPNEVSSPSQEPPNCAYIQKELLKKGVTLKRLWDEYVSECRQSGKLYLMYSQYCKVYHDYVDSNMLTMHIQYKPGDKLMVDWAGATMTIMGTAAHTAGNYGAPYDPRDHDPMLADSILDRIIHGSYKNKI